MTCYKGIFLTALLCLGCRTPGPVPEPAPAPLPPTIPEVRGIDISNHQGEIDFEAIKAQGITYVFIKATQGIDYQDPCYAHYLAEAARAGLTVGTYHFYMTDDGPHEQLQNFAQTAVLQGGDLPPVVDIETLHKNTLPLLTDKLKDFLDLLEAVYGVKPILYTGRNFANHYLSAFGDYPLWLAEYEVEKPQLPSGWERWTFWQWSQDTLLDGLDEPVDADRFNGPPTAFECLLVPEGNGR